MKEIMPTFYFNTKLKPDYRNRYPVYFRFNLNGSNHRLKSKLLGYLADESSLKRHQDLVDIETKYLNALIKYSKDLYQFIFYTEDIERLHKDLYSFYTSENVDFYKKPLGFPIDDDDIYLYQDFENDHDMDEFEEETIFFDDQKPSVEGNDNYRNEFVQYLISTSKLDANFINHTTANDIMHTNMVLPTFFIKEKKTLDYINSCNDLFNFSIENDINMYKWIFEGKGEIFRKKYGEMSFSLINDYLIFESSDIFLTDNIYDLLKNKK